MPLLRRLVSLILLIWLVGTVAGIVCWRPAEAQNVVIDTSTVQYRRHGAAVDNLVNGPFRYWVGVLRFPGWHITFRADSLEDAAARTYIRDEYRAMLVVVDLAQLDGNVDEILLHELLHAKIAAYTTFAHALAGDNVQLQMELQRREEALVTDLSRSKLWERP